MVFTYLLLKCLAASEYWCPNIFNLLIYFYQNQCILTLNCSSTLQKFYKTDLGRVSWPCTAWSFLYKRFNFLFQNSKLLFFHVYDSFPELAIFFYLPHLNVGLFNHARGLLSILLSAIHRKSVYLNLNSMKMTSFILLFRL